LCDFSLETYRFRPAVKDEDLVVRKFPSGCKGFVDLVDADCAVCCKSGVEMTLYLEDTVPVIDSKMDHQFINANGTPMPVRFWTQPGGWPGLFRDGFVIPDGRFLLLQYLSEGTRATVTKALPAEIVAAAKGDVAFEPEERVDLAAQPGQVRQFFRRLFRSSVD
jgi:hypothetical protein